MTSKQTGYIFLSLGLMVMFFSVIFIIFVFTGVREPISVLNIQAPSIPIDAFMPQIPQELGMDISIPKTNKTIEFIDSISFNKMLNLGINLLFMGFMVNFGYKISSLGIQLINGTKDTNKANSNPNQ